MGITIHTSEVALADLQETIDGAWREAVKEHGAALLSAFPEVEPALHESSLAEAVPASEGFDVVGTIVIAVAGRLLGVVPERILANVFETYIWPKLKRRFGRGVTREEDGK